MICVFMEGMGVLSVVADLNEHADSLRRERTPDCITERSQGERSKTNEGPIDATRVMRRKR
jgi:hypothetical protein